MPYDPYAHCDHDVHHFANGVALVRVDPMAIKPLYTGYDRGQGVIVVDRGTGRIRELVAGTMQQLDTLSRSVEGMW